MLFQHNDMEFAIEGEWWNVAGMRTFRPTKRSYRSSPSPYGLPSIEVAIADVEPLRCVRSHGVFNDAGPGRREGSARERVLRIFAFFSR